jgi:segregation and condensation protein A
MTQPLQDEYRVTLETFQGPLDLLLFLIRRAEVDITDIPVAAITDQYLDFLKTVDDIDVEVAGEFLVMAATLIELKSRTLMPPAAEEGDAAAGEGSTSPLEPSDPRYDLVQQLLAYQRFRLAAEELDDRRREFELRFPLRPGRRPDQDDAETEELDLELEDVHVMDLADAYERIMTSIDFDRLGDHVVEIDDTPLALHQEDLLDRLTHADTNKLTLQEAFAGRPRIQRVGLFLATLELARQRRVGVVQDDLDGAIELRLVSEEERAADPGVVI